MAEDGPRLIKLKEVYKRAIQEILKEEGSVINILNATIEKDSFYTESSMQFSTDDVKKVFLSIKGKFTEIFKEKIRKYDLDLKLNVLDKNIKSNRVGYNDIGNVEYINEIFDSYIVDKKEQIVKALEDRLNVDIKSKENQLSILKEEIRLLKQENDKCEKEYQKLVDECESIGNM